MLTIRKDVEVTAEVEVEIELDDIVEAIVGEYEQLEYIAALVRTLGTQDTLQVMRMCIDRLEI